MVTYGEWVQPDEVEVVRNDGGSNNAWHARTGPRLGVDGAGVHGRYEQVGSEYVPVPDAWAFYAFDAAEPPTTWVGLTNTRSGNRVMHGFTAGSIGSSNWTSGAYVDRNFVPWPVGSRHAFYPDDWPPGAVAVEFDDPAGEGWSTYLSSALLPATELHYNDYDDSFGSGVVQSLSDGYNTDIYAAPGGPTSRWPDDVTGTLIHRIEVGAGSLGSGVAPLPHPLPIDLTPHLDAEGFGWLWTETGYVSPRNVTGDPPNPQNTSDWKWGRLLSRIVISTWYRPPRYRFVFDELPPEILPPIRRTFPRDDGRAGGAPRTFPPSKALGSGIRTTGGYL